MFQTQLIQQVVEWERRLEIEEEKRNNHRAKPDVYPQADQPRRESRPSIFERIFRPRRARQPVYKQDPCVEQLR